MPFKLSRNIIIWVVIGVTLLVAALIYIALRMVPYSEDEINKSIVVIDHQYHYEISNNGTPLLFFDGITKDSVFHNVSIQKNILEEQSYGCWVNSTFLLPSCHGRIATVSSSYATFTSDSVVLKKFVTKSITHFESKKKDYNRYISEVNYYLNTHNGNDDGYDKVVAYNDSLRAEYARIEKIIGVLKKVVTSNSYKIKLNEKYIAEYTDENNKRVRKDCLLIPSSNAHGNVLLQVCDSITPKGVTSLNLKNAFPFNLTQMKDTVLIYGKTYFNENDCSCDGFEQIPEYISGDTLKSLPKLNMVKGAPVFSRDGYFIGILGGDTIILRNVISKTF